LLLIDNDPEEEKSLLEEKLKKVTTERAPVAGQQNARGGRSGGAQGRSLLDGLAEAQRGGAAPNSAILGQLLRNNQGRAPFNLLDDPQTPGYRAGQGAAAAAGVLTAVDEDSDDEEAKTPGEFEYFTDAEDDEDDDE
jgi:26S proteasome regulatory subunit N2